MMDCVHGAHVSPVEIYISQVVAWANVEVDVILPDDVGGGGCGLLATSSLYNHEVEFFNTLCSIVARSSVADLFGRQRWALARGVVGRGQRPPVLLFKKFMLAEFDQRPDTPRVSSIQVHVIWRLHWVHLTMAV